MRTLIKVYATLIILTEKNNQISQSPYIVCYNTVYSRLQLCGRRSLFILILLEGQKSNRSRETEELLVSKMPVWNIPRLFLTLTP